MKKLLILICMNLFIYACNTVNKEENTKKELLNVIKESRATIKETTDKNRKSFQEHLVELLTGYARVYPNDSISEEFIFEAANQCISYGDYERAIQLLETIVKYHKEYIKRPESIYLLAFIYDSFLSKKGKAIFYYNQIIKEYPEHLLSVNAKDAKDFLHMSDQEIIKKLLEKNNSVEAN